MCDLSRENEVIDHVGYTRAFFELFEGAIYMHQVSPPRPCIRNLFPPVSPFHPSSRDIASWFTGWQARQYLVVRLDIEKHKAMVRPVRVGYYTSSRNHTDVNIVRPPSMP